MFISLLQWKVFDFLLKLFLNSQKLNGEGREKTFCHTCTYRIDLFPSAKNPNQTKKSNKAQPHYSEAFFSSLFKKRVQYWFGAAQCFSNEASEADLCLPRR